VRFPLALVLASLLLPAAAGASALPRAHAVDVSHAVGGSAGPIDAGATPHIPAYLRPAAWRRGAVHAADHWTGLDVKEERYRDGDGHVLTLATDNAGVDLEPFANLLASTYHGDEIELVHVFVTDEANLTRLCGASAAACYAADNPGKSRGGLMVISYEDSNITHAVIHEYGHHMDNNRYNLGRLTDCGISGDGSRRWFFARDMQNRILDRLSCDPEGDWGQLLPEVYAEDYAQMVGIPRSEYHPAISVPPPSAGEKRQLRADVDHPFEPSSRKVTGRGTTTFRLRLSLPVFLAAQGRRGVRSIRTSGCGYRGFANVFSGTCRVVVRAKRPAGRFSFKLVVF
jgi:hypothetical protein